MVQDVVVAVLERGQARPCRGVTHVVGAGIIVACDQPMDALACRLVAAVCCAAVVVVADDRLADAPDPGLTSGFEARGRRWAALPDLGVAWLAIKEVWDPVFIAIEEANLSASPRVSLSIEPRDAVRVSLVGDVVTVRVLGVTLEGVDDPIAVRVCGSARVGDLEAVNEGVTVAVQVERVCPEGDLSAVREPVSVSVIVAVEADLLDAEAGRT